MGMDAGSVVALVISVTTAAWQIAGYLSGPEVQLIAPTSVTFRHWPVGDRSTTALTATTMNYVNHGRKDYDALVMEEEAELQFAGRSPLLMKWWWFVGPDGSPQEQAHPVVVPGGGVRAHETRFAPRIRLCPPTQSCDEAISHADFLPFDQFLALAASDADTATVRIKLKARIFERDDRQIDYECVVRFDSRVQSILQAQAKLYQSLKVQRMSPAEIDQHKDFREFYSVPCAALRD